MSYLESFQISKINGKKLDFCCKMYYLYYVINDRDMNNEINPTLLDSEFDSWICENLMYQLMIGYDVYGSSVSSGNIKDSGNVVVRESTKH
jgi:hypothetical protein